MREIGGFAIFMAVVLVVALGPACTEKNPDYDPDYVPPCDSGDARCSEEGDVIELCRDGTFVELRECWEGTECHKARCVATDDSPFCEKADDCDQGRICTAVIMSGAEAVGNACIPVPYPEGKAGGEACTEDDECQSGWCFKGVCYQPCYADEHCPDGLVCRQLSITVDSLRGVVQGCIQP